MKKIFSFLCLIVAVTAMTSCSSAKEEKGTSGTGNAVLDNIFERKSVRAYLNKGVEKEKIDLMLRAGMAAPTGRDIRPWEFVVVSDRAKLDSMAAALPYAKMLTQARNAIIVCGDSVRSSYWYLDCSAAAQNILSEEVPLFPLDYKVYIIGMNKNVDGFIFNANGNHILYKTDIIEDAE